MSGIPHEPETGTECATGETDCGTGSWIEYEDGTRILMQGGATIYQYEGTVPEDIKEFQLTKDGTQITRYRDGADKLVLKSGIIVEKDSEGNKTQTMTDGLKKIDKTDGTKIMHLPGGMIIEDYVDDALLTIDFPLKPTLSGEVFSWPGIVKVARPETGGLFTHYTAGDGTTVQQDQNGTLMVEKLAACHCPKVHAYYAAQGVQRWILQVQPDGSNCFLIQQDGRLSIDKYWAEFQRKAEEEEAARQAASVDVEAAQAAADEAAAKLAAAKAASAKLHPEKDPQHGHDEKKEDVASAAETGQASFYMPYIVGAVGVLALSAMVAMKLKK